MAISLTERALKKIPLSSTWKKMQLKTKKKKRK